MKRKILISFSLVAALVFSVFSGLFVSLGAVSAADYTEDKVDVSLTIHYHRYDAASYTDWNMWLWTEKGGDGFSKEFVFADENPYKASVTVTVPKVEFNADLAGIASNRQGIGFIVRKGEWAQKDVDIDRFVPLNKITRNGATATVEIWLIEGDAGIYYDADEGDISDRMYDTRFISETGILSSFTATLTEEQIQTVEVYADGVKVEGIQIFPAKDGKSVSILLPSPADYTKQYELRSSEFNNPSMVSLSGIFGSSDFGNTFNYSGTLGAIYTSASTEFKLWAPTAKGVTLNIYDAGVGGTATKHVLTQGEKGVYSVKVNGNLNKKYYTYDIEHASITYTEVVDPYAVSAGINGLRGMILDMASTNPDGWADQARPANNSVTDAVIYEAHIRDLSIDPSSGVPEAHRGKFLGLTHNDTKNSHGQSTVVAHMKELGITELHILPMFDYASVDEGATEPQFNWGYDPLNYNVPEGSYSTDPTKGEVRVSELKQMIQSLHNEGIRVIMDVVYNHTGPSADSNFNKIVPGYYYRYQNGKMSNGSGCGNETASEHYMFGKFMKDSTEFWVREYKIDGFRFDLMALHDVETMNAIQENLEAIDPNIMIYGEGWDAGGSALKKAAASRANASQMPKIAVFNDIFRDGVKGSVFEETGAGFANGNISQDLKAMHGLVGGLRNMGASGDWYTVSPTQSINYVSAHDNNTLWDKIQMSAPAGSTKEDMVSMNLLSAAMVFTAQGTPFFQAGEEMLRSKPLPEGGFDHNSYKSPDSINSIKWNEKNDNIEVFNYYKGMIALRKSLSALRISDRQELVDSMKFQNSPDGTIVSVINQGNKTVVIVYNGNNTSTAVGIPDAKYSVYAEGGKASATAIRSTSTKSVTVDAYSATVLVSTKSGGCGKGSIGSSMTFGAMMSLLGLAFIGGKKLIVR